MGFRNSMRNLGQQLTETRAIVSEIRQPGASQTQAVSPTASADEAAAGLADGSSMLQRAAISAIRQVGMINSDLLVQFDVMVLPGDMAPYRACTEQAVPQQLIGTLAPGMTGQAAVLLDEPESVWLDLSSFR